MYNVTSWGITIFVHHFSCFVICHTDLQLCRCLRVEPSYLSTWFCLFYSSVKRSSVDIWNWKWLKCTLFGMLCHVAVLKCMWMCVNMRMIAKSSSFPSSCSFAFHRNGVWDGGRGSSENDHLLLPCSSCRSHEIPLCIPSPVRTLAFCIKLNN